MVYDLLFICEISINIKLPDTPGHSSHLESHCIFIFLASGGIYIGFFCLFVFRFNNNPTATGRDYNLS